MRWMWDLSEESYRRFNLASSIQNFSEDLHSNNESPNLTEALPSEDNRFVFNLNGYELVYLDMIPETKTCMFTSFFSERDIIKDNLMFAFAKILTTKTMYELIGFRSRK